MQIGLGFLQLDPGQLYELTPNELSIRAEGKNTEQDAMFQNDWQRSRLIYSIIYNANVEGKHRKEPQELIPLIWDEKREDKPKQRRLEELTPEERKAIFEKLDNKYLKEFEEGKAK